MDLPGAISRSLRPRPLEQEQRRRIAALRDYRSAEALAQVSFHTASAESGHPLQSTRMAVPDGARR